jgi:hypothetical protein
MNLPAKPPATNSPGATANPAVDIVSVPRMNRLLDQAAELAAGAGLPPDAFASIAWQAYLRAFPGLAEQMAAAQFDAALEELRNAGRLAKA